MDTVIMALLRATKLKLKLEVVQLWSCAWNLAMMFHFILLQNISPRSFSVILVFPPSMAKTSLYFTM